jgi:hypothetical protein
MLLQVSEVMARKGSVMIEQVVGVFVTVATLYAYYRGFKDFFTEVAGYRRGAAKARAIILGVIDALILLSAGLFLLLGFAGFMGALLGEPLSGPGSQFAGWPALILGVLFLLVGRWLFKYLADSD